MGYLRSRIRGKGRKPGENRLFSWLVHSKVVLHTQYLSLGHRDEGQALGLEPGVKGKMFKLLFIVALLPTTHVFYRSW